MGLNEVLEHQAKDANWQGTDDNYPAHSHIGVALGYRLLPNFERQGAHPFRDDSHDVFPEVQDHG